MAPSPECSVQSFEVQRASHAGPLVVSNLAQFTQEAEMARMTKAQLVDENIALRHNLERLEAQVAHFLQLVATKGAANTKVGDPIKRTPQPRPGDEMVVATYTKRDGSVWNKVRIGYNLFVHRPA